MAEEQASTAGSWLDNFIEYVKQAVQIVQLKSEEIDRAKDDEDAFTMGLVIIALAGVGAAIGTMAPFLVIIMPIFYVIGAFIVAGIFHLIATMAFKGEGEFLDFFRPFSLAFVLQWVNVIWVLNMVLAPLAGIWLCVVAAITIERVYGLDRMKAVLTVVIPVAVLMVLGFMFFTVMLGMVVLMGLLG